MNCFRTIIGNFLFLFIPLVLVAQDQPPVVSDAMLSLDAEQRIFTLEYELMPGDGDEITVWLKVSEDGDHFWIPASGLSGDVGVDVSIGSNQLQWEYDAGLSPEDLHFELTVWDDAEIDIQALVDQVDSNSLEALVRRIEGIRHYQAGPEHLENVKDTIEERFRDAGLAVRRHDFNFMNTVGQNIIGKRRGLGEEGKVWVMDGHFDSVSDSPGADDNASAVAGMLAVVDILKDLHFRNSIQFIGFDLEEQGIVGSQRYVDNEIQSSEDIEGVYNFEMIGYYSEEPNSQDLPAGFSTLFPEAANEIEQNEFRGDFLTNVGNSNSTMLISSLENAADLYVPNLKVISLEVPGDGSIAPDLRRSDHASFWDEGIPALMITDGANFRNNNYHTPGDTAGTLNYTFMQSVVQATLGALVESALPVNGRSYELESPVSSDHQHVETEPRLLVYPNPGQELITIEIENGREHFFNLSIFSLDGKGQYHTQFLGSDKREVNLSHLPPGNYMVVARNREISLMQDLVLSE